MVLHALDTRNRHLCPRAIPPLAVCRKKVKRAPTAIERWFGVKLNGRELAQALIKMTDSRATKTRLSCFGVQDSGRKRWLIFDRKESCWTCKSP